MATTNRIVLLNRTGEELFSGASLFSEPLAPMACASEERPVAPNSETRPPEEEDEEPIPATLRSSVLLRAHEPVSRPIIVDEVNPPKGGDAGDHAA